MNKSIMRILGFLMAVLLGTPVAFAGNTGVLAPAKLSYQVSVDENTKDGGPTLVIRLRNNDARSTFVNVFEMPGVTPAALHLYFFTDQRNVPTNRDFWVSKVRMDFNPGVGYIELKPKQDYIARIPLGREYDRVLEMMKKGNVYILWSFKLRVFEESVYMALLKGKKEADVAVHELPRVGGLLTLHGKL